MREWSERVTDVVAETNRLQREVSAYQEETNRLQREVHEIQEKTARRQWHTVWIVLVTVVAMWVWIIVQWLR